jgi:hypothetical protein
VKISVLNVVFLCFGSLLPLSFPLLLDACGTAGVLRFSLVLLSGSAGPGRGVVRLLSESSSEASWDCELDSSNLDSGEAGSGAISVGD